MLATVGCAMPVKVWEAACTNEARGCGGIGISGVLLAWWVREVKGMLDVRYYLQEDIDG